MIVKVSLNDAHKTIKEYENLGYLYIGSNQYMDIVTLTFRDPITDIQFHEGDYVESSDGKIGYISSICHCDECKKRGFFEPTITYSDGTTDYISNYSVKTVSSDYKQIGTQKFSTKDVLRNRITALEKENKGLKEEVNHLTKRNHELLDLCCFYDMGRNGTK